MDCNMPGMDGYDATTQIRQFLFDSGLKQPIISAVTGHSENSYIKRAVESGMNQVLSKPVNFLNLDCVLKKLKFQRLYSSD
mmetsp:Transcript_12848/g.21737  ORF Transcript_12848/g.21737 Transcript_12848/m.21737 type:complete len:81 (-) Transcript_12848:32-274(-)